VVFRHEVEELDKERKDGTGNGGREMQGNLSWGVRGLLMNREGYAQVQPRREWIGNT